MEYYNKNNYWNNNGRFQKEYEEMRSAIYKGEFSYNKQELNTMHKYYRYFNDGDLPKGSTFKFATFQIESYLETQANIAIAKAYLRYKKDCSNLVIKFYAKQKLKGITNFYKETR